MNPELDPKRDIRFFYLLVYLSIGSPLTSLWRATEFDENNQNIPLSGENGYSLTFEYRRDTFLWAIERMLQEKLIKLHRKGVFLESSIEEQVEAFRAAWPSSQRAADEIVWGKGSDQVGTNRMDLWFFMEVSPAGVAWRRPDGSYQIAD